MNSNKGFSLLEILVAFSIMAVSLSILLQIFSSGVNTAIVAEEYTIATQIAESIMAKVGVEKPVVLGQDSGEENEKYRWNLNINSHLDSEQTDSISDSEIELLAVNVIVQWGAGENVRTLELNSLKPRQSK